MIKTRFDGITDFPLVGKILMQMNEHWNSGTGNPKYIAEIGRNSSLLLVQEVNLCNMSSDGCNKSEAKDENRNVVSKAVGRNHHEPDPLRANRSSFLCVCLCKLVSYLRLLIVSYCPPAKKHEVILDDFSQRPHSICPEILFALSSKYT